MESPQVSHHAAWNKGKLVGQKAPLKLSFVRSSAHDERSTSCWGREGRRVSRASATYDLPCVRHRVVSAS